MIILLAAATSAEIKPFIDYYRNQPGVFPHQVDVVITGIGLVAATYSLSKQTSLKQPDLIIQAGIGGCFDKTIALGVVLAVKQDRIADLGVVESGRFLDLADLGLLRKNQFPFTNGWLPNKNAVLKKVKMKKVN